MPAKQQTRQQAQAQRRIARERFRHQQREGKRFTRGMLKIAKHVGDIVGAFAPRGRVRNMTELQNALSRYAELLTPWARSMSAQMLEDVKRRDNQAWINAGREIGFELRNEVFQAPTGKTMLGLMNEQVDLITSLPRKAAERVHKLTIEGMFQSTRAREIAAEIERTGQVTRARAMLIARTEVARTASALTQSRAEFIGSEGYIWRTADDSDVRNKDGNPIGSHRKLNGKFIPWDQPPVASTDGTRAHAGMIYNCRCWMEPVLPEKII